MRNITNDADLAPVLPGNEAELLKMARAHWATYRPRTFTQLQQSGYLEEALQTAVRLTLTAMEQLVTQQGMEPGEAWELVREEWALLPQEETPESGSEE